MRLRADDVFYCPLPFHHNNALTLCWSAVLTSGATLAMARKFSASGFWRDIRASRATAFVYIGELCRYLLNQPPGKQDRNHQVRVVIGNGLRPEIWDEFQQRFGIEHICEFYGSSEGNLVFINAFGLPRTAGFTPMPYAIVAFDTENECPVRDAQGFMRRVAVGETGLLITEVSAAQPLRRLHRCPGHRGQAAARRVPEGRRVDQQRGPGALPGPAPHCLCGPRGRHLPLEGRERRHHRGRARHRRRAGRCAGQRLRRCGGAQRRPCRHGGHRDAARRGLRRPGHGAAACARPCPPTPCRSSCAS